MSLPFALNPHLDAVPVYQPGRPVEEVARELGLDPQDVIKLASNENPLGPSRLALAAMRRALGKSHFYPDGNAFYLKQKLGATLQLSPENLILGNGSNEVIEMLGHVFMNPASEVVVSQYCFAVYPIVSAIFGARLITVPAQNYGHALEAMRAAITPATRVVFVANPNNPTGTTVSKQQLASFISSVPPEVVVAMDEAYIEFLDDSLDLLPSIRDSSRPNLILMRTFSKIYGLAGLRIGYGIAHPELIAAMEKVRQPFNINAISQAGALAALDDRSHVEKTRRINKLGKNFFEKAFRKLRLEYLPSGANFILVRVGNGAVVFEKMQRAGVIVRPMGGYGLGEWIRISMGTSKQNHRCLEALQATLQESY